MDNTSVVSSLLTAVAATAVVGFVVKNSKLSEQEKPPTAPEPNTRNVLMLKLREVQSSLMNLQRPYGGVASEFMLSDEQKKLQQLQAHEAEIKRHLAREHFKQN